jgi:hypothetical protein
MAFLRSRTGLEQSVAGRIFRDSHVLVDGKAALFGRTARPGAQQSTSPAPRRNPNPVPLTLRYGCE